MGLVYRAFDSQLERSLAIKILPSYLTGDRERLQRFIQEAKSASALNHPNVAAIYEIGSDGDTPYIAMELVAGETLRAKFDRGRVNLRDAVEWIRQVAEGLAAAHGAGVIHRDIKPENILITQHGFAKIVDFGLAKLREQQQVRVVDAAATA